MRNRIKSATLLGEAFFNARNKKELSVLRLSKLSGVSRSTIIDIELGIRNRPCALIVFKLSKALNVSPKNVYDCILKDGKISNNQKGSK